MTNTFNEYQYSPVRLKLGSTGEIFNIGVIMMDANGQNRAIKTIDSFKNIAKCLKIENADSQDFILEKLKNKFKQEHFSFGDYFSNSIFVESPEWLNSERNIEEELDVTFDEIVTISHATQTKNTIGEYTNTKIITKISNIAKEKGMKNIAFRKKNLAHKQIDTVTFGYKNKIITAGEVCSPHVEGFMEHFASSTFALEQVKATQKINALLIYLPLMEILKTSLTKNYDYAVGYSKERGYEVIKSKHFEEYLDAIADLTKRSGGDLFSEIKQ